MRTRLLSWQRELYDEGHRDRTNLLIHLATWPLFVGGFASLVSSPVAGWPLAAVGLAVMVVAMALQGRGHRRETTPPVPFAGAGDVLSRILAEQLVTFPRYLFGGGFARAWRAAGR
jgi:hypothetical protein